MEIDNTDNKFRFITIAAARCQQLQRGARPRVDVRSSKPTTVAREEGRRGLIAAREPEHVPEVAGGTSVIDAPEGTDAG